MFGLIQVSELLTPRLSIIVFNLSAGITPLKDYRKKG